MTEMNDEVESGSGKQVIARAAAVLRALENQSTGLSLSQIATASELPRTTVHRIVAALEAQRMVTTGSGGVRLGPAITRLAASAHTDIVSIARPFIEALGRRTRETVDLCVFRGAHAISVDQYASDQELRVVSPVGTAFPVHCTAHGKALLAEHSDAEIKKVLGPRLERRTDRTIERTTQLLTHISAVRSSGFATDVEEHAAGVCGIGVFLRTGLSGDYAIALAVPALRFHERLESLRASIMQTRSEIEAVTGG
jgi:DNA-binding IclR family transcriptional regulator